MNRNQMPRQHRRNRFRGGDPKHAKIRIALAGNPNAGKTSLFNMLTGQSQHVGNYPGVTVEKKMGSIFYQGHELEFTDLPGTYSLSAYSIEEIVARDFVLKEKPDIIIDVLDSTNIERNLYLCLQFQELGVPIIGALNMSDDIEKQGMKIDEKLLGKILGIPFIKTVGTRTTGKKELLQTIIDVVEGEINTTARHLNYGPELEQQHNIIIRELETDIAFAQKYNSHWIAIKLLENDSDAVRKVETEHRNAAVILPLAQSCRDWIQKHFAEEPETVVAEQRYAYIHGACREAVYQDKLSKRIDYTEMIDKVVLHRFLGVVIFFAIMFLIYQLTFVLGNPISDIIDGSFAWLQDVIIAHTPDGILRDFLVDGIIGGVGGVLVFFPIVLLLFLGLSLLEDTGYMARAAFVMDKFMHIFGLHGRSFIPLMVSTGCAVPGVMSARTLVNPKDRILTILVSPLMMCGAKVPVIAMLAASFFPENAGKVFWGIWFFSWILALLIASLFRKVFFKGERSPFVMELPPYRMPTLRGVLTHVWEKSWSYVRKAGTFILAASVIIWFILYFPRTKPDSTAAEIYNSGMTSSEASAWNSITTGTPSVTENDTTFSKEAIMNQIQAENNRLAQQQMMNSFGGRIGRFVEPVFRPCGFDWRLDVSLFAGFAAKEVIISSMGIVYGIGEADVDLGNAKNPLKTRLQTDPKYNRLNMLAFMLFVLIYLPCMATMAVVKKELGKWRYPLFLAAYTVVLAWLIATGVYQIGTILGVG